MASPLLTVYTIGFRAGDCRLALAELRRQTIRASLDVILLCVEPRGLEPEAGEGFARFERIELPRIDTSGEVMALAVRRASTPYVTYAEEHTHLEPSWAERLLEAHLAGHDVVGFAMANANPGLVSWAHLYGQFGPAVDPVQPGPSTMLAGHHISYRRSLLLEYGELLPFMLEDESALLLDLRARDIVPFIEGRAVSHHVNVSRLGSLMRLDYLGQRTFASSRARVGRWSPLRRAAYAAAAPVIPLVRLVRVVGHIRRTGRTRQMMPRLLPPLLCMLAAGAVGESAGYLLGAGRSARRRTALEFERSDFLGTHDRWSKDAAR